MVRTESFPLTIRAVARWGGPGGLNRSPSCLAFLCIKGSIAKERPRTSECAPTTIKSANCEKLISWASRLQRPAAAPNPCSCRHRRSLLGRTKPHYPLSAAPKNGRRASKFKKSSVLQTRRGRSAFPAHKNRQGPSEKTNRRRIPERRFGEKARSTKRRSRSGRGSPPAASLLLRPDRERGSPRELRSRCWGGLLFSFGGQAAQIFFLHLSVALRHSS